MTRPRLLLAAACALALAAACASSQKPAASGPPASPVEARSELVSLERRIEQDRTALGLVAPGDRVEAARLGEEATRLRAAEPTEAADASTDTAGGAEKAAPAPPSRTPAEPTAARQDAQDSCRRDPCRYTRAICEAASRICEIARYLQEPDARARCGRALQDCQQARKATQDRCPGC